MTVPKSDPEAIAAARARRERRRKRQTVIFGSMAVLLALGLTVGVGVATNVISSPFTKDFSSPAPNAGEIPPCPTGDGMPVDPTTFTVNVYNSVTRTGLANLTAQMLKDKGFTLGVVGDQDDKYKGAPAYDGTAEIRFGPNSVNQAYTVAGVIPDAALVMDNRKDDTVDVIVGAIFDALQDSTVVQGTALTPIKGCRNVDKLVTRPSPTAADTPAADATEGDTSGD